MKLPASIAAILLALVAVMAPIAPAQATNAAPGGAIVLNPSSPERPENYICYILPPACGDED